MTDNRTPDLQTQSEAATADAMDSVTTTEATAPAEDAPVEDASAEDARAEHAPAEDAPAEDAPAEDAPAEDAPAGGSSSTEGSPIGVTVGEPHDEGLRTQIDGGSGERAGDEPPVVDESSEEASAEGAIVGDAADGVPGYGDVAALLEEDVVVAEDAIDDVTMRRALEAILMVSDEPLPALTLARTVGRAIADVTAALGGLSEEYTEQGRGFDLREVGGGWRYYTREDAALYVERFVLDGQQSRLTQAALETLAVVAYKQPVSRARVSAIRGVNVDGVMRTLISRGLLEEAGPDTESQSTLYKTTSYFLERMGMQSLDDLPELAPYLPEMDDMEEELAAHAAAAAEPAPAEEDSGPIENDLAPPPPAAAEDDDEDVADTAGSNAESDGADVEDADVAVSDVELDGVGVEDAVVEAGGSFGDGVAAGVDGEDVADVAVSDVELDGIGVEDADVAVGGAGEVGDFGVGVAGDDGVEVSGDETDDGVARGETDESATRG